MSAFIISNQTANAIAKAISENTLFDVNKIKTLILDENIKSVNIRYNEENQNDFPAYDENDISDADVVDEIDMFQYQCAEYDGYENSTAYQITQTVKELIITQRQIAMYQAVNG